MRNFLTFSLGVLAPAPLLAAPASQTADVHGEAGQDIVVTAPYVAELDLLSGKSTVTADELASNAKPQIADQLVTQPGVSASSFAPGASRPVLRGLQGDRVRILTDGIGTLDASSMSADHGVAIDPLTAERVEVFHGPASLLFGSQAIGGAINVFDRRIPRHVPKNGYHLDMTGSFLGALHEKAGGGAFDISPVERLVLHVDGSYRKTNDLSVGGYVLTPELRAGQRALAEEATAEGHTEEAAQALKLSNLRGRLPDSATRNWTFGTGAAFIDDDGSLGISVGWYDSLYGIPSRPGAAHAHDGEASTAGDVDAVPVSIDLRQFRADLRGEVKIDGPFADQLRLRVGYADYRHSELEGTEVGTSFMSNGFEGRLELVQADRSGWRGVLGAQAAIRDFDAVGAEAFVPANRIGQFGLFALQEWSVGQFGIETAARFEHVSARITGAPLPDAPVTGITARTFNSFSGAIGASWSPDETVKLGINLSRTARAPSGEELFSFGPHVASQSFEQGSPALASEHSLGLEAYATANLGAVTFTVGAYHSWFDDFIYAAQTGEERGGLPVNAYRQAPARHWGAEAELNWTIIDRDEFKLMAHGVADFVRATIVDEGPAPRIPPLRVLGGLNVEKGRIGADLSLEHVAAQRRTADYETPTDSFWLANAAITYRPFGPKTETFVSLSLDNIFDATVRRHASFTKDFAPLAGRDVRIALRCNF